MPPPFFPNSQTLATATARQTALAMSVLKLFKFGFSPNVETLVADLDTNEADFTTYAPKTITAWLPPVAAVGGGFQITAATIQWSLATLPAVGNSIGGWWLETMAGEVVLIRQFDEAVAMSAAGNSVTVNPTIVFPPGN